MNKKTLIGALVSGLLLMMIVSSLGIFKESYTEINNQNQTVQIKSDGWPFKYKKTSSISNTQSEITNETSWLLFAANYAVFVAFFLALRGLVGLGQTVLR